MSTPSPEALLATATTWAANDPDPATKHHVEALIAANDIPALEALFGTTLAFGTAGMRGHVGPGTANINRAMVSLVSAGLAKELCANPPSTRTKGVVLGRDMRHGSAEFAQDTMAMLTGAGVPVFAYPDLVHTPLVSFATRQIDAQAGVMVTASHNPPQDNGYKVFWAQGAQIIPPIDEHITAHMADLPPIPDMPKGDTTSELYAQVGPEMAEDYLQRIANLLTPADTLAYERGSRVRIVYTPMHGVAGDIMMRAFTQSGFTTVHPVAEQFEPDPDFPTVAFPNPEEPGALDLALALAQAKDADIVIANDPDGDRIGVAIPTPSGWRALCGDEIGTILAYDMFCHRLAGPHSLVPAGTTPLVATTVVSSQLLGTMAKAFDVAYAETLTGFKWMADAAAAGDLRNEHIILAYEQALGVSVGDIVRDKDGVSAAIYMVDLCERLLMQGSSLAALIEEMDTRFGCHVTAEDNVLLTEGTAIVDQVIDQLRTNPPTHIQGVPVTSIADHEHAILTRFATSGAPDTSAPEATPATDGAPTTEPIDLEPTRLMRITLANGSRLMVRPSGTEPKLKFYAEVVLPVQDDAPATRAQANEAVRTMLEGYIAEVLGAA